MLLRNSDIIILDEATSNIDFETEKSFMEDFRNIVKNKTVIIIAYRLLSLQIADRVYFLENGSIVDEGKHKDLINRCEGYRKLVLGKD